MAKDDPILTTMRYISKREVVQKYGVILPDTLTNQEMKETDAYKTYYAFSYGKEIPKPKYSKVPDDQFQKVTGINEGAGVRLKVPNVPSYDSESDEESWTFSPDEDDADEKTNVNDDPNDEEEEEEKIDDDEVSSDHKVYTSLDHQLTDKDKNQEGDDEVKEVKRGRDDQDKDEDPSARSNRGSKRWRSGKEAESSKEPRHMKSKSISSLKDVSRYQPEPTGKSARAEENGQKVDDLEDQSRQEFNTGNDDETSIQESLDVDKSQWNPSSSLTPDREWHKTKIVDKRPPQP
uniref:Uncharacterized protein n=1 Tax=Tanacetum cinerariifolium TaxID=118510 RepID=A0A6L2JSQ9_TANCI|nr:hypothetical protein [Tanacetum cinerariifolium]